MAEKITPLAQRRVEEEGTIQTRQVHSHTPAVTPELESRLQVLRVSGRPLPASTRVFFEPRFGCDFAHVHIHTGAQADETARTIHARAFTVGRDIVFGKGINCVCTG